MPFGRYNAPAIFEQLMETVLRDPTYESCLALLYDLVVIDRMFQEHLLNLRKVFLREARLQLNPEKSQLYKTTSSPSTVKAENITMPMPFPDDHAKKSVPIATKSRHGQTSSK
jgi:hypothetical protein